VDGESVATGLETMESEVESTLPTLRFPGDCEGLEDPSFGSDVDEFMDRSLETDCIGLEVLSSEAGCIAGGFFSDFPFSELGGISRSDDSSDSAGFEGSTGISDGEGSPETIGARPPEGRSPAFSLGNSITRPTRSRSNRESASFMRYQARTKQRMQARGISRVRRMCIDVDCGVFDGSFTRAIERASDSSCTNVTSTHAPGNRKHSSC